MSWHAPNFPKWWNGGNGGMGERRNGGKKWGNDFKEELYFEGVAGNFQGK